MMDFLTVAVDSLHADPSNLRVHDDANHRAIMASLKKFGQQKPIVIDQKGVVLAGNGTLAAARALGWSSIAVVRSDLVGPDAVAYAIADNRTAELATWDEKALAETLRSLQSEDFDLDAVGFTEVEVDELLEKLAEEIAGPLPPEPGDDRHEEQYGVIVVCKDAAEQEQIYEHLAASGYTCKIVAEAV